MQIRVYVRRDHKRYVFLFTTEVVAMCRFRTAHLLLLLLALTVCTSAATYTGRAAQLDSPAPSLRMAPEHVHVTPPISHTARRAADVYLPLDEGNSWRYFQTIHPPGAPVDTLFRGPYDVSDPVAINDTLYYVVPLPDLFSDTLRTDEAGRIWARMDGEDRLLFDFTLADGASYLFREHGDDYEVTVTREPDLDIHLGAFADAVTFRFDIPQVLDDERSYTFAPDVGLVQVYGIHGDYSELYSAVVDGVAIITHRSDRYRPADIDGHVYPNPIRDRATIVFAAGNRTSARISIHDLLGRQIDLLDASCSIDQCRAVWKPHAAAAGLYVARMVSRDGLRSIPIVVGR